jgi:hypothetical protein
MEAKLATMSWASLTKNEDNYADRLNEIGSTIQALGVGWTKGGVGVWPPENPPTTFASTSWTTVTHTSGAMFMFMASWGGSLGAIHANNGYGGDTGNRATLRIAFRPSSRSHLGFNISQIGDNPKDSSTWCDDYGFYHFKRFDHNSSNLDLTASGRIFIVMDADSPYMLWFSWVGSSIRNIGFFMDDTTPGFLYLADSADTERSCVVYDYYFGYINYRIPMQTYMKDGVMYGPIGTLTNDMPVDGRRAINHLRDSIELGVDPQPLERVEFAFTGSPPNRIKGMFNPEVLCYVLDDIPRLTRMDHPGTNTHYVKITTGSSGRATATAWPADKPYAM